MGVTFLLGFPSITTATRSPFTCIRNIANKTLDFFQNCRKLEAVNRRGVFMAQLNTFSGVKEHKVVSQKAWLKARKQLLVKEKKFSKKILSDLSELN